MKTDYINGSAAACKAHDWPEVREKIIDIEKDVHEMTQYLKHLEALPDIRDTLLSAATGRNQIDLDSHRLIVKILAGCLAAEMFAIIFLITGEKFGLFSLFK